MTGSRPIPRSAVTRASSSWTSTSRRPAVLGRPPGGGPDDAARLDREVELDVEGDGRGLAREPELLLERVAGERMHLHRPVVEVGAATDVRERVRQLDDLLERGLRPVLDVADLLEEELRERVGPDRLEQR